MKFDFSKSTDADFRNKLSIDKLDILMKNVLYITHQVDKILKILTKIQIDKSLQSQVDEFFEDETSPQTDTDEQV